MREVAGCAAAAAALSPGVGVAAEDAGLDEGRCTPAVPVEAAVAAADSSSAVGRVVTRAAAAGTRSAAAPSQAADTPRANK